MSFPNVHDRRAAIAPPPRQPADRLPKRVRQKLTRLHGDAQDASDAMTAATRKLNAEVARSAMSEEAARNADNVEALERARARQRQAQDAFVLWRTLQNRINVFMGSLVGRVAREYEPPKAVKGRAHIDNNKTPKAQVDAIRKKIASVKFEIEAAKRAPLPKKDREARARAYLADLIAESKPSMRVGKDGTVSIGLGEGTKQMPLELTSNRAVFGGAIALVGVDAALKILLPQLDDVPGAMTVAARRQRIDELNAQMLELERVEESIIDGAQADGQVILRRPDVNIAALLGVVIC